MCKLPTFERLDSLFSYDCESGQIKWKIKRKGTNGIGSAAGYLRRDGYSLLCVDGVRILGHRVAWMLMKKEWPSAWIDHINGNPSDNRWANLRAATPSENNYNKIPASLATSGHLGVEHDRRKNCYYVRFRHRGRNHYFGIFHDLDEAARVAREKRAELAGDFLVSR